MFSPPRRIPFFSLFPSKLPLPPSSRVGQWHPVVHEFRPVSSIGLRQGPKQSQKSPTQVRVGRRGTHKRVDWEIRAIARLIGSGPASWSAAWPHYGRATRAVQGGSIQYLQLRPPSSVLCTWVPKDGPIVNSECSRCSRCCRWVDSRENLFYSSPCFLF
jgi:hypothetical protein